MVGIVVDPAVYLELSRQLGRLGERAGASHAALLSALGSSPVAAGSDPVGRSWSRSYGSAAQEAADAYRLWCLAIYRLSASTRATGLNYLTADASTRGCSRGVDSGDRMDWGAPVPPPGVVPSTDATAGDRPPGGDLAEPVSRRPDGDVEGLDRLAACWRAAAGTVEWPPSASADALLGMRTPGVDGARRALLEAMLAGRDLREALEAVADSTALLGSAISSTTAALAASTDRYAAEIVLDRHALMAHPGLTRLVDVERSARSVLRWATRTLARPVRLIAPTSGRRPDARPSADHPAAAGALGLAAPVLAGRSTAAFDRLRSDEAAEPSGRSDDAAEHRALVLAALAQLIRPGQPVSVPERRLHRLVEREYWIFGARYADLLASEAGLTRVRRLHEQAAGIVPASGGGPVRRSDGSLGRVDLVLTVPAGRFGPAERLVVELKRPGRVAQLKDLHQLKSYAYTMARDPRFTVQQIRWECWLVAGDLAPDLHDEANQDRRTAGLAYVRAATSVWVRTWDDLLRQARDEWLAGPTPVVPAEAVRRYLDGLG